MIHDQGVLAIMHSLPATVEHLSLRDNVVSASTHNQILKALAFNSTLTYLGFPATINGEYSMQYFLSLFSSLPL